VHDPNDFVDGVPLTPRDLLDRIATLLAEVDGARARADDAKAEAKQAKEDADEKLEELGDLVALHRSGRPCFLLVDGGITAEPPRDLPLWEVAAKSQARAASQAESSPITAPVYLMYGEGRTDSLAFEREVRPAGVLFVQNEGPGSWSARVDGEVIGLGWRSAADAMLASMAHAKAEGEPEDSWRAVAKRDPATLPAGETKAAEGETIPPAGETPPAAPAKPNPSAQADDGMIYRANLDGELVAVAQVSAPGPWSGYKAGECLVSGLPTSDAAKAALLAELGVDPKVAVGWMSKANADAPEAPKKRRRTAVAK